MANPAIIGKIADTLLIHEGDTGIDFVLLIRLLVLFAGVILGSAIMKNFQNRLSAKLSKKTIRTLRRDLFFATEKLPLSYIDSHSHGDLMSRMTNDVENISNIVSQTLATLISSVITIFGTLAIMLCYSPLLTVIALTTIFFTAFIAQTISKRMRKYFLRQQIVLGQLNGHVEETVTGYNTILAFNRQKQSNEEFRKYSEELKKTGIKARTLGGMMGPLMGFSGNMTYLVVAVAGGILADPPILILDEATASVDTRTEMNIQQAMITLMQGRTSIIIAHRLSTIIDAEAIVVLDSGRLVEIGSHNELIKNHGAYYNLYNQQFTTGKVI